MTRETRARVAAAALAAVSTWPNAKIARVAGVSTRTVARWKKGSAPHEGALTKLRAAVVRKLGARV